VGPGVGAAGGLPGVGGLGEGWLGGGGVGCPGAGAGGCTGAGGGGAGRTCGGAGAGGGGEGADVAGAGGGDGATSPGGGVVLYVSSAGVLGMSMGVSGSERLERSSGGGAVRWDAAVGVHAPRRHSHSLWGEGGGPQSASV